MKTRECACVIGSGMAGLMAARVLADEFDKVIVFERDPRPGRDESRPGAAQGDHFHTLARRGQLVIEALFPGLIEDLVVGGAIVNRDAGTAQRSFMFGDWAANCVAGFSTLQLSRPLLEYAMRRRVEMLPNTLFRYGVAVAGLRTNIAQTRVTGVSVGANTGAGSEDVDADLVIDASGRGAAGLGSLKPHVFPPPREDIVSLDFGCASAMFEIPDGFQADWSSLLIGPDAPHTKAAFLQVVEGGRWLVSLGGRGEQRLDATEAGFRDFARGLPSALIHDLIRRARLIGPVKRYRFAASLHRRVDLLSKHPDGFLALGDAVCSLNPVYGRGMTIAAQQVEILADCLTRRRDERLDGLWRDFYPRTLETISVPWNQSLTLDMLYETTKFHRPESYSLLQPALIWAQKLSLRDPALRAVFLRIANLVPGPGDDVTLSTLLRAQARLWLTAARAGVAPTYRFAADDGVDTLRDHADANRERYRRRGKQGPKFARELTTAPRA